MRCYWLNLPEKPSCGADCWGKAWAGADEHEHGGESDSVLAPQLPHPQHVPRRPRLHLHAGAGRQILARKGLVFAIRNSVLINRLCIVLRCHRHEHKHAIDSPETCHRLFLHQWNKNQWKNPKEPERTFNWGRSQDLTFECGRLSNDVPLVGWCTTLHCNGIMFLLCVSWRVAFLRASE